MEVEFVVSGAVESREDFGRLLNARKLTGEAVEVGTHHGVFAQSLLDSWHGKTLHCVDPWANPPGYDDPAGRGDRNLDYETARRRLRVFGARVRLVRSTSLEAAAKFADESLDFVYIDADHRRECVLADCRAWWLKVAPGGILAGHDLTGVWEHEVRPAVCEFAAEIGQHVVSVVRGDAVRRYPPLGDAASWFFEKPPRQSAESTSLPVKMVMPSERRPGAYRGGIIQIHVTRACDMACFGCTQASNLGGRTGFITPEQFERACQSLEGYWGVVGVFGGNPCLHPKFPELCEILRRYFPREQRGLWSNNLNGHGAVCRETFDPHKSNLNVHLSQAAYDEMKRDWPECRPVGLHEDSRHSPPFVALHDVIADEAERWRMIGECDVNQHWSAMVCVVRGEVQGFFCEIAGAQAMLHQYDSSYPDTGLPAEPGWWRRPASDFEQQVRFHCHRCGIPLRTYGELAVGGKKEQVSAEHADVYRPKRPNRLVQTITTIDDLMRATSMPVTKYIDKGG